MEPIAHEALTVAVIIAMPGQKVGGQQDLMPFEFCIGVEAVHPTEDVDNHSLAH